MNAKKWPAIIQLHHPMAGATDLKRKKRGEGGERFEIEKTAFERDRKRIESNQVRFEMIRRARFYVECNVFRERK